MNTLIPVNVVIGDRSYRLKIEPADEEVVRKMVKVINDKIIEFKTHFAGKDMQDYIAMVLLWFATEQTKPANELSFNNDILKKVHAIELLLDKGLGKK